ncbi:hypothetical protein FRC07_002410 [Ceratobasidium sp. 392]|nr:hypothetical protein FRC07_002410 [Ceratobasidium sp. 392]
MSHVMLPNSAAAVPKTNAEREAAERLPDPPDPVGEEMFKDARVWRTYVREADRWDKELIDGRNRFIIESLGDLKPDPAESSAQTLLLVSKTLAALANGQPAPSPTEGESDPASFSPPRSAVIVNVLWLLSLSLSVAVSLIAMLAKDWCYKFMSGRSGQIYEQARRRQKKWNEMERWKMAQVLEHLPGMMHLALLAIDQEPVLFAAGLCVYLWDINVKAAIPVLVVTALAFLTYGFATIVPLVIEFCPYTTPLAVAIMDIRKPVSLIAYSVSDYLWRHVRYPQWLKSTLEKIRDRLDPDNTRRNDNLEASENKLVPTDTVTSQMVAWMVTNCEDSRSVDIALQALAGAYDDLPQVPLEQCRALSLIFSRLKLSCALFENTSEPLSAQQQVAISTACRYLRGSANCWYGDGSVRNRYDRWAYYVEGSMRDLSYRDYPQLHPAHRKLLTLSRHRIDDSGMLVAAASLIFSHVEGLDRSDRIRDQELAISASNALDHMTSALESHFHEGGTSLSATVLQALVKGSIHYLVGRWPREEDHGQHGSLPGLLARVFVTCYGTAPDTAQAAALALAAGAFANYTYPGGEEPTLDVDAREKRAVQVLQHYQTNRPDRDHMFALYMFGFYSWLPWFISDGHDEQLAAITRELGSVTGRDEYWIDSIIRQDIRTMPPSFSLRDPAIKSVSNCMSSTTGTTQNQTSAIATSLLLFFESPYSNQSHIGLYLVALVGLCHAESKDDQKLCMRAIARQRIPYAPLTDLNSVDGQSLLEYLCRTLISMNSAVSPFAAVHFGLLVACIASDEQDSLEDRQSALRPLLSLHDWSGDLQGHDPVTLSDLVSHLEEIIRTKSMANSSQRTMQFVANFCSSSPNTGPDPGPSSEGHYYSWRKLADLKDSYEPSLEELERLYAEQQGGSTSHPPQVVEDESVPAPDTTETEARPDEQVEVVDQDTSWGFEGPYSAR